jgi:hypothetical protein
MGRGKGKAKGPVTLWDKVNKFDTNFAVEIQTMTSEALSAKLVTVANHDEQIESAREADSDLISLAEQLKTAKETYTVPLKENRMRKKLIIEYLRSRGNLSAE